MSTGPEGLQAGEEGGPGLAHGAPDLPACGPLGAGMCVCFFLPLYLVSSHRDFRWKNAIDQLLSVNSMFQITFPPRNCSNYLAFGIMWAPPQRPPHKPEGTSTPDCDPELRSVAVGV